MTEISPEVRKLAFECWGHDGYYDDENGSHEDIRELIEILQSFADKVRDQTLEDAACAKGADLYVARQTIRDMKSSKGG